MHGLAVPPPPLPERLHEHAGGVSREQLAARTRLDDAAAWYIGHRIFLALAAAHAAREPTTRGLALVIPRDVSPANVLVPWDGYVTLSDLRIVRAGGPAVVAGTSRPSRREVTRSTCAPITAPSEAGHRVFVDGRLAGSGGAPLVVRCGTHEVRVGSAGRLWRVEVPCDGAVEVTRQDPAQGSCRARRGEDADSLKQITGGVRPSGRYSV